MLGVTGELREPFLMIFISKKRSRYGQQKIYKLLFSYDHGSWCNLHSKLNTYHEVTGCSTMYLDHQGDDLSAHFSSSYDFLIRKSFLNSPRHFLDT